MSPKKAPVEAPEKAVADKKAEEAAELKAQAAEKAKADEKAAVEDPTTRSDTNAVPEGKTVSKEPQNTISAVDGDEEVDYEDEAEDEEKTDATTGTKRKLIETADASRDSKGPEKDAQKRARQEPPKQSDSRISNRLMDNQRRVPPARNPLSNILHVRNFVRPFTIPSAKAMLEEAGGGPLTNFWMDTIRSNCYATFETKEQAAAARAAVYDMVWPVVGGRRLAADFASESEATDAANGGAQSATQRRKEESANPRTDRKEGSPKRKDELRRDEPRRPTKPEEPKKKPKTLDDLFRSTKTEPRIYWLPAVDDSVPQNEAEVDK